MEIVTRIAGTNYQKQLEIYGLLNKIRKDSIHPQEVLAKEKEITSRYGNGVFESLLDEAAVTSGAYAGF